MSTVEYVSTPHKLTHGLQLCGSRTLGELQLRGLPRSGERQRRYKSSTSKTTEYVHHLHFPVSTFLFCDVCRGCTDCGLDDLTEMIIAAIENERKATESGAQSQVPGPAVAVEPPQAHSLSSEAAERRGFSMNVGDLGRMPTGGPMGQSKNGLPQNSPHSHGPPPNGSPHASGPSGSNGYGPPSHHHNNHHNSNPHGHSPHPSMYHGGPPSHPGEMMHSHSSMHPPMPSPIDYNMGPHGLHNNHGPPPMHPSMHSNHPPPMHPSMHPSPRGHSGMPPPHSMHSPPPYGMHGGMHGGPPPGMGMHMGGGSMHGGGGMSMHMGGGMHGDPRMHEREMWMRQMDDPMMRGRDHSMGPKMEGEGKLEHGNSRSLSPGERKKLSRKEFRETIGVQLYQDLISGEYSYDEVIMKYKKLYPEYESKFTRNFCSKTRCGRIMTASTSEPKRNVKAGDPKIQRISKKSPRKPWTRMTKELVRIPLPLLD